MPSGENRPEPGRATAAPASENAVHLAHVQHPQDRCLLDEAAQRPLPLTPCEIDQRTGRARTGDPLVSHDLVWRGRTDPMPTDALDLPTCLISPDDIDQDRLLVP